LIAKENVSNIGPPNWEYETIFPSLICNTQL